MCSSDLDCEPTEQNYNTVFVLCRGLPPGTPEPPGDVLEVFIPNCSPRRQVTIMCRTRATCFDRTHGLQLDLFGLTWEPVMMEQVSTPY